MSDLEHAAKSHLLPMIQGRRRTRYRPAQALVASWGVKAALVAGSKFEPRIPRDFYRDFHASGKPVEQTRVWLGHAPHLEVHDGLVAHADPPRDETPPPQHNGFQAVMSVGHLIIYVGCIPRP